MAESSAVICVSGVSKTYRGLDVDRKESGVASWIKIVTRLTANRARTIRALDDVSFRIEPGEIFGIYGANGAGKTTLIRVLSGLLVPDEGTVVVNGHSGIDAIKDQISYISTNGWMGLEWQLTVRENLVLYGHTFGMPTPELSARCAQVLDAFDMAFAQGKHIAELSAGMRQKVTLMRGFLLDRPIIYLDEPTVSLDVQSSAALRDILVDAAQRQGKTVIVTSHSQVALSICRRILMLHAGRAVALGETGELARPLEGIAALHLTCAGHQTAVESTELCDGLLAHARVRDVQVAEANGRERTWQVDLLVDQADGVVGEVIDWFIAQEIAILGMRRSALSLQEIYAHYVAAHRNASAHQNASAHRKADQSTGASVHGDAGGEA